MTRILDVVLVGAIAGVLAVMLATCTTACRPATWGDVQRGLDVACVMANVSFHDADIARVCRVADEALPLMRSIAGEHRAGLARVGAARCPP